MPSFRIEVPYSADGSKNRKFIYKSHKKLSPNYVAFRDAICYKAKNAVQLKNLVFEPRKKVWVSILLVKTPKMTRTDASNFIEVVCDAIKEAINVDDCWFSGSYDWREGKESGFFIQVKQGVRSKQLDV